MVKTWQNAAVQAHVSLEKLHFACPNVLAAQFTGPVPKRERPKCVEPIRSGAETALGAREKADMPPDRLMFDDFHLFSLYSTALRAQDRAPTAFPRPLGMRFGRCSVRLWPNSP